MLGERLFYFIHGIVTMFFIMTGITYMSKKPQTRILRLTGYLLFYWGALEIKDLIFYAAPAIRDNQISYLLMLIDMTAIPAGCFFVVELLSEGWCTFPRVAFFSSPFALFALLYVATDADWVLDTTFVFAWLYTAGFMVYIVRLVRRYTRLLLENYSNIEYLPVKTLKFIVTIFVAVLTV